MENTNVYQWFERVCTKNPCSVAVDKGHDRVTYKNLNKKATQISEMLLQIVGSRKSIVGIMLDPSIDYVAVVLGILKAGHVFMPINLGFPSNRIVQIIEKSGASLFIALRGEYHRVPDLEEKLNAHYSIIENEQNRETVPEFRELSLYSVGSKASDSAPLTPSCASHKNSSPDACYVMPTSGSTGNPKLILGSHKGLCHFLDWEIKTVGFTEQARCSFLSHTSFDVSLRDIFAPLLCGGTVFIPENSERSTPHALFDWLEHKRITHTHIVPTLLRAVLSVLTPTEDNRLPSLTHALIAGEPLYGSDVENWRSRVNTTTTLINLYGPSETTLAKLYYRIPREKVSANEVIPIGLPIPDTEVMIITEENKICINGEIGEIYIRTSYKSLGYLGDCEQEATHFVADPLSNAGRELVYKTGDLGQYTDGGIVKCLGRIDNQIKLHGNRIELEEVEAIMRGHPEVSQAAVSIKSDSTLNQRLVGYIIPEGHRAPSTESLRQFLSTHLPDYMIPTVFVVLSALPLTHSNKLDRNALPAPTTQRPILEQEYAPARSKLEFRLTSTWKRVLNLETIGINDNFFDLGGNSILAMQLITLVNTQFHRDFAVTKLFEYPTIQKLAGHLQSQDEADLLDNKVTDRASMRWVALARRRKR